MSLGVDSVVQKLLSLSAVTTANDQKVNILNSTVADETARIDSVSSVVGTGTYGPTTTTLSDAMAVTWNGESADGKTISNATVGMGVSSIPAGTTGLNDDYNFYYVASTSDPSSVTFSGAGGFINEAGMIQVAAMGTYPLTVNLTSPDVFADGLTSLLIPSWTSASLTFVRKVDAPTEGVWHFISSATLVSRRFPVSGALYLAGEAIPRDYVLNGDLMCTLYHSSSVLGCKVSFLSASSTCIISLRVGDVWKSPSHSGNIISIGPSYIELLAVTGGWVISNSHGYGFHSDFHYEAFDTTIAIAGRVLKTSGACLKPFRASTDLALRTCTITTTAAVDSTYVLKIYKKAVFSGPSTLIYTSDVAVVADFLDETSTTIAKYSSFPLPVQLVEGTYFIKVIATADSACDISVVIDGEFS